MIEPIWPQPWATSPERLLLGDDEDTWNGAELFAVVDVNDPDFPYIADAVKLMRIAGFDMTDPGMLRLAVDAGHRKAATARDDVTLLGHAANDEWQRSEERDIELPGHCSSPAVVYYMRLGNRVKIGWTNNITQRLMTIQPEELMATEPGGRVTEDLRHEQFKALRVVGEWFRYEGSLVEHIESLRSRDPSG